MYSGNASPSFYSPPRRIIYKQSLHLSSIDNPMAAAYDLDGDDFSNTGMGSDSWTTTDMRFHSRRAMCYGSGGLPPSIGDVRQIGGSKPSGSNQMYMYSDGQPPSLKDVRIPEPSPSPSEASCTRYDYDDPDEHELQQQIYKRGAAGKSNHITAYSGHDNRTHDLASTFTTSNVVQSVEVPAKPSPRIRVYVKVYKSGSVERSIDIAAYSCYNDFKQDIARIFSIEGLLDVRTSWQLVFMNRKNHILLRRDPWREFVNYVGYIKILSPQEVGQMSLNDGLKILGALGGLFEQFKVPYKCRG